MEEQALPEDLLRKASITSGGEHAWRMEDVKQVIHAARDAGLACLGGQVQFQFHDGTCEGYWINYDPSERRRGEPWVDYVARSADETTAAFDRVCQKTDFRQVACQFDFARRRIEGEGCDPRDHLWFPLYFTMEEAS